MMSTPCMLCYDCCSGIPGDHERMWHCRNVSGFVKKIYYHTLYSI